MDSSTNYFDAVATTWDDNPKRVEMSRAVAKAISDSVPLSRDTTVLDYGCGTGLLSMLLSSHVKHVTGADSSEGMLRALQAKITQSKTPDIDVIKLDLAQDPVPSSRYHLVVSGMALHHVEDIRKVIAAFHELLLPGGYVCIADLDTEPGIFHEGQVPTTVRHFGFNRDRLMAVMGEAGFRDCTARTAYTMRKPISDGTERDFPVFLIAGRKQGKANG
jgi:ubiquinone/menaquinone biosynthesis C-methylase UbiE